MKKKRNKLNAIIVTALSLALMLSACGSSTTGAKASKDSIPLSEVIFSGEDVLIYDYPYGSETIDKKAGGNLYLLKADGTLYEIRVAGTLGDVSQMSIEDLVSYPDQEDCGNVSWNIFTNETGSGTKYIKGSFTPSSFTFGNFQNHTSIYDCSYMVFLYTGPNGYPQYCLIRDTDDTIDKTIYLDAPGTDGFTTDGK